MQANCTSAATSSTTRRSQSRLTANTASRRSSQAVTGIGRSISSSCGLFAHIVCNVSLQKLVTAAPPMAIWDMEYMVPKAPSYTIWLQNTTESKLTSTMDTIRFAFTGRNPSNPESSSAAAPVKPTKYSTAAENPPKNSTCRSTSIYNSVSHQNSAFHKVARTALALPNAKKRRMIFSPLQTV